MPGSDVKAAREISPSPLCASGPDREGVHLSYLLVSRFTPQYVQTLPPTSCQCAVSVTS
jgi:hypothetical protein